MPADILAGFEFVPSDSVPSLTFDNQLRIYLNTSARRLLSIKAYDRLAVAYRTDTAELAIIKPSAGFSYSEMMTSNFVVDRRFYLHARQMAKLYGFERSGAPYYFEYNKGTSDGNVFIFRLIYA